MPIQSKVVLPGWESAIPGVFSRVIGVNINTQTCVVTLKIRDWATKNAAQKILTKKEDPLPDPDFDPNDPVHVAQWEAAGSPDPKALDVHGNKWKPSLGLVSVSYFWDGEKTAQPYLQEREIILSHELALAVATHSVAGDTPKPPADALESMTAQLYLAAMATGKFEEPEAVSGLDPKVPD